MDMIRWTFPEFTSLISIIHVITEGTTIRKYVVKKDLGNPEYE